MDKIDFSFKVFETILTYAVDEVEDTNEFNILRDLDFDEDSFFKKLYVSRKKEEEFYTELSKDTSQILIKGYPGTGKTTLLRKVLRDFQIARNAFLVYIDFKKQKDVNYQKNVNSEDMSSFIENLLTTRVVSELNANANDVTDFLVTQTEHINSQNFNNPEFISTLEELKNRHNFHNDGIEDFLIWFKTQREKMRSDEFKQYYLRLSKSLKAHNYLYYVAFSGDNQLDQRMCIVCYDNVDSIIDSEIRDTFCRYMRQYQQITKISAKSVISMRNDNSSLKLLSDQGAYIVSKIDVTYDDFIDSKMLKKATKEHRRKYGTPPDPESIDKIKKRLVKRATEVFSNSIYEQRAKYIRDEITDEKRTRVENNNPRETIDLEKIRQIEEVFSLILKESRVQEAFLDLCNFDRRKMLVYKTHFVNYLLSEVGLKRLDLQHFKLDKESIKFIIESYFYGWMNKSNQFYDANVYNFPRDLKTWAESNEALGCSLDHLIFAGIYNLSDQIDVEFTYDKFTTIGDLLEILSQIGYDERLVRKKLFSLYKDKLTGEHKGLVEISRFSEVLTEGDFRVEDELGLTPRSYYLTRYSSLKFISVIASIRSDSIKGINEKFIYDDKYPITPKTIEGCLRFLCELAKMNLCGIFNVKKALEPVHGDNWFSIYKQLFCIRTSWYRDPAGSLLIENLISSIILFLDRQKAIDEHRDVRSISRPMIENFKQLERDFGSALLDLTQNGIESLEDAKKRNFCDKLDFSIFSRNDG